MAVLKYFSGNQCAAGLTVVREKKKKHIEPSNALKLSGKYMYWYTEYKHIAYNAEIYYFYFLRERGGKNTVYFLMKENCYENKFQLEHLHKDV